MNNFKGYNFRSEKGFTLIELSIVIIITGILLVAVIQAFTIYDEKQKIARMDCYVSYVADALEDFPAKIDPASATGEIYGRMPCPAPIDGTTAGNNFDSEICAGATATIVTGPTGEQIMIGKLPAATLGISNDHMKDLYGNYIIYAVALAATDSATYSSSMGGIRVLEDEVDEGPASATFGQIILRETHDDVQYLYVSMGKQGNGAFAYDGSIPFAVRI